MIRCFFILQIMLDIHSISTDKTNSPATRAIIDHLQHNLQTKWSISTVTKQQSLWINNYLELKQDKENNIPIKYFY